MARTVLSGAPGALYVLQAADLPLDLDLRFSHWEYVDASGFDLSAYDMREVDLLDCKLDGVILPSRIAGVYSRRSTFLNATIPTSLPVMHIHDIGCELLRQRIAALPAGADRQLAIAVRSYFVTGSTVNYGKSFTDCMYSLMTVSGLTIAQMANRGAAVFEGYPRWLRRVAYILANPSLMAPAIPTDDGGNARVITETGDAFVDLRPAFPGGDDRALLAMRIASRLGALTGYPWRVHVTQLTPYPLIEAVAESRITGALFGWWIGLRGARMDGAE